MTLPGTATIQRLIQDFFEKHLVTDCGVSRNTVLSYRDALRLFLSYVADRKGCAVDQLDHTILDVDIVRSFLGWLETERGCGVRTRNHRLAVIKSFLKYVASVAPEHVERCRRIRAMPSARFDRPEVEYLNEDEVVGLFKAIDPLAQQRDRALLLLAYNTGARVQEIVDLDVGDVRLDSVPLVTLKGKGGKYRTCPLWERTVEALEQWLIERGDDCGPIFLNAWGRRLSRSGIAYILRKVVERSGIAPKHASRVTPHVIRHTTAMHLLESGVDITTIAAWLGHSQLTTTHGYMEISQRMKLKAIDVTTSLPELARGKYPEGDLFVWLSNLGRCRRYAQPLPIHVT